MKGARTSFANAEAEAQPPGAFRTRSGLIGPGENRRDRGQAAGDGEQAAEIHTANKQTTDHSGACPAQSRADGESGGACRTPGRGDFSSARTRLDDCLATFAELSDVTGIVATLLNCAILFSAEGQYEDAVRSLGAATMLLRVKLRRFPPFVQPVVDRRLSAARAVLQGELFRTVWRQGEATSLDDAVTYAHRRLVDVLISP